MDEQSIVKVLAALGVSRVRKSGSNVVATCPFAAYSHSKGQDRNPSFSMAVNPSGPSWFKCFACGASGKKAISLLYKLKELGGTWRSDLHMMIRDQEGGSPRERLSRMGSYDDRRKASRRGGGESYWDVKGYERKFREDELDGWKGGIPKYLLNRGVSLEQAQRWELGFDMGHQRLVIPVRDEHRRLVGWSKRAILAEDTPKYLHAKGMARENYLYGEQFIDKSVRIGILNEGFFDVWSWERRGYVNALGTMGTVPSITHIAKLKNWFDLILIFPHNDPKPPEKHEPGFIPGPDEPVKEPELPPGLKMARAYRDRLRGAGVKAYIGPMVVGKKDVGDWSDRDFTDIENTRFGSVLNDLKRGRPQGGEATAQGSEEVQEAGP